jgi:PAS domain S-box-containing protein
MVQIFDSEGGPVETWAENCPEDFQCRVALFGAEDARIEGREVDAERLYEAAMNVIGIYIIDREGQIIEANDAFLRMMGYARKDLLSGCVRWTDLTRGWCAADSRRLEAMKMTGTLQPFESEYFRKDGTRVRVLVGGARFEEAGNGAVVFTIDLTERERAEGDTHVNARRLCEAKMELANASRVATVGQLSASIAHEINQPLSGIVTNASTCLRMLSADPPNVAGAQETARRSIRDANRAADIVTRLRALYAKREISTEAVNLNEASREVISHFHRELQNSGVDLLWAFAEDLPSVRCDRVQLQQVIMNLLRNAAEAMSDVDVGPRQLIVKTARAEPDSVLLAVQDSGPGIDPANRERIFDAFYTTKTGGLGMGLSVCRTIIEAHGGQLWATAAVPNGAIFQFTLPVIRSDNAQHSGNI